MSRTNAQSALVGVAAVWVISLVARLIPFDAGLSVGGLQLAVMIGIPILWRRDRARGDERDSILTPWTSWILPSVAGFVGFGIFGMTFVFLWTATGHNAVVLYPLVTTWYFAVGFTAAYIDSRQGDGGGGHRRRDPEWQPQTVEVRS